MERDLTVASVSMACPGGNPADFVLRLQSQSRELRAQGVELACFPEACLTGYSVREEEARQWAIPVQSPWVEDIRDISRRVGIILLVGLMEHGEGDRLYLSQLAICPQGPMSIYRKAHLSPQESLLFSPGHQMGIFSAGPATGAMALCYETHFPEWIARLALEGAEVFCFPSASPGESPSQKMDRWLRFMPARAYDNGAFVLACNQAGENGAGLRFPAVALILDPKGRMLAAQNGEQQALAVATLRAEEINRVRSHPLAHFLRHRRPELYGK